MERTVSQHEANERLRKARADLAAYGEQCRDRGIDWETEEFLRLNQAVIDAEVDASWWVRGRW